VHCVLDYHLRPDREAVRQRLEGATMLTREDLNPDTTRDAGPGSSNDRFAQGERPGR